MNFKIGLKTKIMAVTLVLIIIISLSAIVNVNRGIYLTKQLLGQQAFRAADVAFNTIDGNRLKELIDFGSDSHPYYRELQPVLAKARLGLGLRYLYVMTKNKDGSYIYVVDGLDPEAEDFSNYGESEDDESYFVNFEKTLSGNIVKDDFYESDIWGSLVSAYIPIRDNTGDVVAFLGADLEADDTLSLMNRNTIFMIAFVTLISLFGAAAVMLLSYKIANPLFKLSSYSEKISRGEVVEQLKLNTKDEIGTVAAALNSRITAVRNLLNNIGQGFLTFGEDMLVDAEYSYECRNIFGEDIEGKRITELIYPGDTEQQRFLESVFLKLLKESSKRELYFPLLSDDISINGRDIHIDYKIIKANQTEEIEEFMIILTDITDKKLLQDTVEKEKDTLKMVVKVIVNHNDFLECVRDYKAFCDGELEAIIRLDRSSQDIVYEVFRNVHTFKGNFSQLDMNNLVRGLNEFEEMLSRTKTTLFKMSKKELREFFKDIDMLTWLEQDLAILKQVMGEEFLSRFVNMESALLVDKAKLITLESRMLSLLSSFDCKIILPEMRKLRGRKFIELLKAYTSYVEKLAERMDKQVVPLKIDGGSFIVFTDTYNDFARSLTHVFRNAIDHGIEGADERVYKGKSESGSILCKVRTTDANIEVSVKDDGRGLDFESIKRKAIEKGIMTEEAAAQMPRLDIINLIFMDDFSTKQQETEFSGRGIGLSAVKKEVEKLGGRIEVITEAGRGTEFVFYLPLFQEFKLLDVDIVSIMEPLVNTAGSYILQYLEEGIKDRTIIAIEKEKQLQLSKYSAFTDLKGILGGRLVVTFDELLAKRLSRGMIIGEISEDFEEELVEDSLAEFLNIILGNSIKLFPGLEELIIFTSPAIINSSEAVIKYPSGEVWTSRINIGDGSFRLSFVANE